MKRPCVLRLGILFAVAASFHFCKLAHADEPIRDGIWLNRISDDLGYQIRTAELSLTPKAEAKPALKHKFIADDFELQDGNAAIFYLKAMGFLEQNRARDLLSETRKKAWETAQEKGEDVSNYPPYSWLDMAPKELPVEAVKQYLSLLSFQPRHLAEAARRRSFSLDRNIRQVASPASILIPDIQIMRELSRNQSLRCRIAIAEGRVDDAIAILGQQYAMAKHLGHDEFLVSSLVGAVAAGIAYEDAIYLLQLPSTPNLYWAFSSLPNPIIDMKSALAFERQMFFEEIKLLRDVDETPRNAGYWQDFIERIFPQVQNLYLMAMAKDQETSLESFIMTIGAAYPGAKRYLIEDVGMVRDKVESFTTAQTFFLAVKRFYEQSLDEHFKWNSIPFAEATANSQYRNLDTRTQADCDRIGWASLPTSAFLPNFRAAKNAQQRAQQSIAMLQTVEAIRMHGAANGDKLPSSLDNLIVPVPVDPFTGKPLMYELNGDKAVLTGHRMNGLQDRLVLRFVGK